MNRAEMEAESELMNGKLVSKWDAYLRGFEEFGCPFFTGLKGDGWLQHLSPESNDERLRGMTRQRYVGQWLLYAATGGPYLCVNVPGNQAQQYQKGDCFDVGEERFTVDTPQNVIDGAMQSGLEELQKLATAKGCRIVLR
jgi:hypothetical protein